MSTPTSGRQPTTNGHITNAPKTDLFKDVVFYLDSGLTEFVSAEIHALLVKSGANGCRSPFPPGPSPIRRFDEAQITHYITSSIDFPEYDQLRSLGREIVTPMWVTRSVDLQDKQSGNFYSPDKALFFSGLCICTSELPNIDTAAIHAGVTSLGGQIRKELTREVTHLIVPAPGGSKFEAAMKYGPELGMVTVLPHWFEESLKVRQLVPIDLYRFPSPPLLDPSNYTNEELYEVRLINYHRSLPAAANGVRDPATFKQSMTMRILGPGAWEGGVGKEERKIRETGYLKNVSNQHTLHPGQAELPTSTPSKSKSSIFKGKKVYLCGGLVGSRTAMEDALKERIIAAGGKCWGWNADGSTIPNETKRAERAKKELESSDIVVARLREGWEFWTAFMAMEPKVIGNLTWLFHVLSVSALESPLDRLLHYPLPPKPIPEFVSKKVTISNYSGPARDYVKTLIECIGATFEGSMSKSTDFVISASDHGAKVKHAKAWHIPIANHLWLENCFLEYAFVPISSARAYQAESSATKAYQDGPSAPGLDLMPILGMVSVPRESLRKWAQSPNGRALMEEAFKTPADDDDETMNEAAREPAVAEVESHQSKFADEDGMQVDRQDAADEETGLEKAYEDDEDDEDEVEIEVVPAKNARGRPSSSSPAKPKPKPKKVVPSKNGKDREASTSDTAQGDAPTPEKKPVPKKAAQVVKPSRRARSSPAPSESDSDTDTPPPKNIFTDPVVVTGRRSAAVGAAAKLALQMPDANKFALEQKYSSGKKRRESHGSQSKRRHASDSEEDGNSSDDSRLATKVKGKGKGRASSKAIESDEEDEEEKKPSKKLKVMAKMREDTQGSAMSSFDNPPKAKKKAPGPQVRLLSTGLDLNKDHPDVKALAKLGAKWTENYSQVTHLVVNGLSRTEKFLSCLAYAPNVVTVAWVRASVKAGELLDPEPYLLKDEKRERELGDTLENIVARARAGPLFKDLTIYLTKSILPGVDVLRRIIQCGGGIVQVTTDLSKKTNVNKIKDDQDSYVVSCPKDRRQWEALVEKAPRKPIYSVEAVFQSVVLQKLMFGDDHRIDSHLEK